jgi:hypothetical protein
MPWQPGRSGNPATRFKPGNRANPHGRPKGPTYSTRLRTLLQCQELAGQALPDGKTIADLLAEVMVRKALQGDYRFTREILDRTEGKVTARAGEDAGTNPPELDRATSEKAEAELEAWRRKMVERLPRHRNAPTS